MMALRISSFFSCLMSFSRLCNMLIQDGKSVVVKGKCLGGGAARRQLSFASWKRMLYEFLGSKLPSRVKKKSLCAI